MGENEIDRILADVMTGENISAKDRQQLERWKQRSGKNPCFEKEIHELAHSGSGLKSRSDRRIVFRQVERAVKQRRRNRFIQRFAVAAGVVLLVSVTAYIILPKNHAVEPVQMATGIIPGAPRAELVLPEGQIVHLDTTTKVVPIANTMAQVMSYQNTLIYDSGDEGKQVEYHTIRVPRGGEYNLQLSDNTKVYLNAGSSLRYPVRFTGDKREVVLIGEGYFEVAKDSTKPFIVKAGNIDVRVMGTAFNVNAYPDEACISTTLVEGKVQVDYGTERQIMQPGTRLVYARSGGRAEISAVDVEVYTSWKDGYYYFKQETLENIMDVLSRWYDLNVFYQNADLKRVEFGGRLKRYEDINYLLRKMEETEDVEFIIKGNSITVKRKTD